MFFLNPFRRLIPRFLPAIVVFLATITPGFAESPHLVDHLDPIESVATLSLAKVVDLTLEKYPDASWLKSLEQEAAAIALRRMMYDGEPIKLNKEQDFFIEAGLLIPSEADIKRKPLLEQDKG